MGQVPIIDLTPWFDGDGRERVAEQVDAALSDVGFLLITGHGIPAETRDRLRAAAMRFFSLPEPIKRSYATAVGGRGWLPPGAEANGYAEGTETPPDLKESYACGHDTKIGDPALDELWFPDNVYPAEVPAMEPLVRDYLERMRALADELLIICAVALGLKEDFFVSYTTHPSYGMNINWYPSMSRLGAPEPGQFRIGPHTDFGTVTILDRQPGVGGLQVYVEGEWVNAPYVEDSFTINIGDLLARWTGDRWRSNRHRVLPPDPAAPDEELVSLIFFYECDPATRVESLPVGPTSYPPVRASDYLHEKLKSIAL
jgi:isopenicillin N synthase-like dioxygenase